MASTNTILVALAGCGGGDTPGGIDHDVRALVIRTEPISRFAR
jgi:hypothetical protein